MSEYYNVNEISTDSSEKCSDPCSHESDCKGRVGKVETKTNIVGTPVPPTTIHPGPFVAKFPIVLAEVTVTIPILAHLKLEEKALEIKRIKKNVYITQCHLIPPPWPKACTGTLFLEGFIRKNVEYATEECSSDETICGKIKQCTFHVPFDTTTTVTFLRSPIFTPNPPTVEFEIFEDHIKSCDICREPVIGSDPCQQHFSSTEFFNEPVFCELVSACFNEADIHRDPKTCCENPIEQSFRKITEKCLLTLTFKVLQKQQVGLKAEPPCPGPKKID
jgi:hypothetical protein